jgi:hypothetical protein
MSVLLAGLGASNHHAIIDASCAETAGRLTAPGLNQHHDCRCYGLRGSTDLEARPLMANVDLGPMSAILVSSTQHETPPITSLVLLRHAVCASNHDGLTAHEWIACTALVMTPPPLLPQAQPRHAP